MTRTSRLTYANVASTLALVLVVGGGGTAVAAATLAKNSVGSKQIRAGAVKGPDLARNAVTSKKVKDGSLTGADVDEATLAKVPRAATADLANTATTAANVLRAAVRADGSLVATQSSAGVSTADTQDGVGTYAVRFGRDVTTCTAVSSIMDPGTGFPSAGTAATTGQTLFPNGIYVVTRNKDGDLTNRPFNLVVVC